MKPRVFWLGGNQPRHLYYINRLMEALDVVGGIMQMRGNAIPQPPPGLDPLDEAYWRRHFEDRAEAEARYFGEQQVPAIPLLQVDRDKLNSEESAAFVRQLKPDMAVIFGCGMVREPLFSALPRKTINLHLGLSPRYRGAATLFWPFYFLEPNWAGTTLHYIVASPDAGTIIHQSAPQLQPGDRIHDVSCKAVVIAAAEAQQVLQMPAWNEFTQKPEAGKNFLESDFQPRHLRMIYQVFDNDIVDAYLNGDIHPKEPHLKRQF